MIQRPVAKTKAKVASIWSAVRTAAARSLFNRPVGSFVVVTVCGRVKGTSRAVRVKLQNGGAVEGDIFHRSLSIDENSQFEGSSRRVENPTDLSLSVDAASPQKKGLAPVSLPPIKAELADGPKH